MLSHTNVAIMIKNSHRNVNLTIHLKTHNGENDINSSSVTIFLYIPYEDTPW